MNIILILRSEVVCLTILLLLMAYSLICGAKSEKTFLRVCICSLGHVIFDGITVYTVNNIETTGRAVNYIMHFFMYLFAMCFSCEMFCYIIKNIFSAVSLRRWMKAVRLPVALYVAAMPFLEINYYQGNGTMYSMGSAGAAAFALTVIYMILGAVLLLINIRRVETNVVLGVLPCSILALTVVVIQLLVPELLFTGAVMTIITTGLFFSIENPVAHYMKRAYIDLDTGIKNKNCYIEDMRRLNETYFSERKGRGPLICAVCDINCLKAVNDSFGHMEGDELIRAAADVLSKTFEKAYNVYRVGGDEFIAVFIGVSRDRVEGAVADVRKGCKKYTSLKYPLSIAIGIADSCDDDFASIYDVVSLADKRMYENKTQIKDSTSHFDPCCAINRQKAPH